MIRRQLCVRGKVLDLPAFFPVTTFGGRFPLDELVQPFLGRLAPGIMVSYHYARQMKARPQGTLFIDSGGFASLFEGSEAVELDDAAAIRTREGDLITPADVLRLQEERADIGATVDFLVPPDLPLEQARLRQSLTVRNALWALRHRSEPRLRLFASVQAWDAASAAEAMRQLAPYPFDGFALGSMVPRIRQPKLIADIVRAIRSFEATRPLHVFGIGTPALMRELMKAGADSFDSSSYVRAAIDGKVLASDGTGWIPLAEHANCASRLTSPILQRLGSPYLELEGESNRMALALHNLSVLSAALFPEAIEQVSSR